MKPPLNDKQARAKDKYLRQHYHITLEDYNKLREQQNYCCAICDRPENIFKTGMAVDHNHKTGEVRGLLCWECNRKLGRWHDNDEHVRRAGLYVTCPPVFSLKGTRIFTAPGRVGSKVRAKVLAKLNGVTLKPKRRKTSGISRRRKRPAKS